MTIQQEIDLKCRETSIVELYLHTPMSEGCNQSSPCGPEVRVGTFCLCKIQGAARQEEQEHTPEPYHSEVSVPKTGHKYIHC